MATARSTGTTTTTTAAAAGSKTAANHHQRERNALFCRRAFFFTGLAFVAVAAFEFENARLDVDAVLVVVQAAFAVDDAMARIEQRHGIARHHAAHGARGVGLSHRGRHPA